MSRTESGTPSTFSQTLNPDTASEKERVKEIWRNYNSEVENLLFSFKQVNVVGRSIEFDEHDPIFKLNRKVTRKNQNRQSVEVEKDSKREFLELEGNSPEKSVSAIQNTCRICGDQYKNLKSKLRECDFCNKTQCEACCQSLRRFPNQIIGTDDHEEPKRNPVCKMCNAKFYMKDFVDPA